jgi:hypothetical protein
MIVSGHLVFAVVNILVASLIAASEVPLTLTSIVRLMLVK